MANLWSDAVADHRRDVRLAVLDAAWQLVHERGALGVTMGHVAESAGIGRATLYKYFGGVEEILVAAHAEHVDQHLAHLETVRAGTDDPEAALRRLLSAYAHIRFDRGKDTPDLRGLVHSGKEHEHSEQRLQALFAGVVQSAQEAAMVRSDVAPVELASYCVSALAAASAVPTRAAVERLVGVVESGLRGPEHPPSSGGVSARRS